jgi:hypothetical protein
MNIDAHLIYTKVVTLNAVYNFSAGSILFETI